MNIVRAAVVSRMKAWYGVLPAALILAIPTTIQAQATEVTVGRLIRVTVDGDSVTGTLAALEPDEWRLSLPDGRARSVSPASVGSLEVWVKRRHVLHGLAIGAGVGLAGAAIYAAGSDCSGGGVGGDICQGIEGIGESFVWVAMPLAGAAVGSLVGAVVTTGSWRPGFVPVRRGTGIGLAITWGKSSG